MNMNTPQSPLAAVAFSLLASAIFAGSLVLSKLASHDTLGEGLNPLQVSHGRFMFGFLAVGGVSMVMGLKLRNVHVKLHVLRSFAGWGGVSLLFAAIAYIPLTDATAISFLNPVFAMVLAIFVLGEKVGRWRWAAAIIALLGVVVLLRPGIASFQPAALIALAAAAVIGVEIMIIKMLSGREGVLQILLINNAIGFAIATVAVILVWQVPTGGQWVALIGMGFLMPIGQACFIQAMARADASFIAPLSYAILVFVGLYDYLIFDVVPVGLSLLGAGIIIAGAALLAWREAVVGARR